MTNIIGLLGYKQVGKSTAAEYLKTKGYQRHNMKDGLVAELKDNFPDLLREIDKEACRNIGGISANINYLFEFKPPLIRTLMQNYGTEVRRGDDPDYWVHQWVNNRPEGLIVTDDVRFLNEAQAIKDCGGTLIRITRDDITDGGSHASETETNSIQVDHTIVAKQGDLEGMYKRIDDILSPDNPLEQ